jgi:putative endonuclease
MEARSALGRTGEDLAVDLYRKRGFDILARNWRCPAGELDVVARRGRDVVFCEVKTRRSARWGAPAEAVDARKQARLRRLAARWLREHRQRAQVIRFDVVSVVALQGGVEVQHIPDAF